VRYTYDTAGRVSAVTTTFNGVTTVLASGVRYQPFGPLKRLTFGHGLVLTRDHDRAYRRGANETVLIQERRRTDFIKESNLGAIHLEPEMIFRPILKLGMLLMETAIMQGIWTMTTTNRWASALCLQLM
jgi:hypothetical protein